MKKALRNTILVAVVVVGAAATAWRVRAGPQVKAARVVRSQLVQTVAATGRVRSPGRLELASQVGGVVAAAHCREGARVTAGELLYALQDDELRAQLDEADAQLRGVEARYDELAGAGRRGDEEALKRAEIAVGDAHDRLARLESLLASGAVDVAQVEVARRTAAQASSLLETARATVRATGAGGPRVRLLRSQLDEAKARRALAARRLATTRLTAPAAGVVADCRAVLGDVIAAGHGLMTLVFDGPSEIVIEPDEKNLALLAVGQAAQASVDAYPERSFSVVVTEIVRAVDPLRGTIEVRLRAGAAPDFLVPDMTTSVEIVVGQKADALVVPRQAINEAQSLRPWLLVATDGRALRREVVLGIRGDSAVEVTSGVVEGDVVLLPERGTLSPGARARATLVEG